jgi:hypothetical protein
MSGFYSGNAPLAEECPRRIPDRSVLCSVHRQLRERRTFPRVSPPAESAARRNMLAKENIIGMLHGIPRISICYSPQCSAHNAIADVRFRRFLCVPYPENSAPRTWRVGEGVGILPLVSRTHAHTDNLHRYIACA